MLLDILKLLIDSNYKAHYIDFSKKLPEQLINILEKYNKYIEKIMHEKDYNEVLDVINAFSVDEPFKELVELRTKKFHMRQDIFQNTEKAIIKKIKDNCSYEKGYKLLNF
jgi:hypothetical protein